MSAAKGILVRPSGQAFRVEANFVDSSGNPVTTGTATCKVSQVQDDGTLRAVDFLTSPLSASVPTVKSLSTDVPTIATLALAAQSCGGVARPYWSATFPATNLTSGGVYLVEFQAPGGANPSSPKVVQFGAADGDLAVTSAGAVTAGTGDAYARIGANGAGLTAVTLAPAGLDAISTTAPAGVASNFREMMVQGWRRLFRKATRTTTQIKTFADDGTTVLTTQTISDDGSGNETQGAAT